MTEQMTCTRSCGRTAGRHRAEVDGAMRDGDAAVDHAMRDGHAAVDVTMPAPRGPLSQWVVARLTGATSLRPPVVHRGTGLGDDLQLALYLCYEPHFSALPNALPDIEWDPELIAFRRTLEVAFDAGLRDLVTRHSAGRADGDLRRRIPAIIAADDGPSLSAYMEHDGTLDQMREFVIHRSPYQLKEGDAHSFAIPRLRGRAKQLLVGIQAGEYGADAPDRRLHADLFAQTMDHLGVDSREHALLDHVPASSLAISNLISRLGLDRRRRGALVGHLAVFEMTSVVPMGRYVRALERLGACEEARRFYEVHVLADAEHEVMAIDMACALATDEPSLVPDVLFGARCAVAVERWFAETLLAGWGVPFADEARPAHSAA